MKNHFIHSAILSKFSFLKTIGAVIIVEATIGISP